MDDESRRWCFRADGGLRGTAVLLDPADGTAFTYPALGFDGLSKRVRHDTLHFQAPFLHDIDPELDRYIHARLPDGGALRFRKSRGIDAIGALLATRHARVGFSVADHEAGRTEVVIAMPTRHAYVGGVGDEPYNEASSHHDPKLVAPFTSPHCETATFVARDDSGAPLFDGEVPLCGPVTIARLRSDQLAASVPLAPGAGRGSALLAGVARVGDEPDGADVNVAGERTYGDAIRDGSCFRPL